MANMFEKGPMNRAFNNLYHDGFNSLNAQAIALQHLENWIGQHKDDDGFVRASELSKFLWNYVWEAKNERKQIVKALDDFCIEFQADFPDRTKKGELAATPTIQEGGQL